MTTIGVLGANGQVGSEVSLFLSQMEGVRIIPICRTEYASAFLRRCGLECRHGSLNNCEEGARLLTGCDLVADFTLPKGMPNEMREATRRIVTEGIKRGPSEARFVYISSTMAFGMRADSHDRSVKRHIFAKTVYGATKRYGERIAFRVGKETNREIYVLRLGNVLGEMQSISRHILRKIRDETAYIPDSFSNTVFAFTIAEALLHIALGQERPGLYTLVNVPQWSWKEIHEFYCRRAGIRPEIIIEKSGTETKIGRVRRLLANSMGLMTKPLVTMAIRNRELILANFLYAYPQIQQRLKAIYSCRNAANEITRAERQGQYRPYDPEVGDVPGPRLRSLSDCRFSMDKFVYKVQQLIENVR